MDPKHLQRFVNKIKFTDTCWIWNSSLTVDGYPRFSIETSKYKLAHRLSYEWWVAPLIKGLTIDHLCEIKNCVNPDHLEQITSLENVRRQHRSTDDYCPNDHSRALYERRYNGKASCLECARLTYHRRKGS